MTDFEWKLAKARRKMKQKRQDSRIVLRLKKAAIGAGLFIVAALSLGAADANPCEVMKEAPYELVEEIYTVQKGDTLWTIGEEYMAKNTYGPRYLLEFIEGIKQNNEELVKSHGQVAPGQRLRITYWVKGGGK